MPKYAPLTQTDLRARMKEIEERIKQMDRREKSLGDLKKWLAARKLEPIDVLWMYRQMKPKRAAKPVVSKKPLQPTAGRYATNGKGKGDPAFQKAVRKKRKVLGMTTGDVGKKIGVSDAAVSNWEQGRNVPKDDKRVKLLKFLQLPLTLGEAASKALEAAAAGKNGAG